MDYNEGFRKAGLKQPWAVMSLDWSFKSDFIPESISFLLQSPKKDAKLQPFAGPL